MKTLTDENRIDIVRYRLENAKKTVNDLLPQAHLFVHTIETITDEWLIHKSDS